jgi:malate dehydrogenase (quinone)
MPTNEKFDFALVGAGIMSATLATFIKLAQPRSKIVVFERLDHVGGESSDAWNNAGTGHAALCELNYMPDTHDGSLPDPNKAIAINEQFQSSRAFWAYCVEQGILNKPESFIRTVPHMSFVVGEKDVDYLRRRHQVLKGAPLFQGMEFSTSPSKLSEWAPLVMQGREDKHIAATWIEQGTDVDYGEITRQLFNWLTKKGVQLELSTEVKKLYQSQRGDWQLWLGSTARRFVSAEKVFIGAGGWALKMLQGAGIEEIRGYGTFPVSGHFLRTDNPKLVAMHNAKVYSQAPVGAPPMSVPHLDKRVVDGKESLLFGPFAGLNPKFLKHGSLLDLPLSVRPHNLLPYLSVAVKNFDLVKYLIREVTKSRKAKIAQLREFVPTAQEEDWTYYEAGQRAQIIKPSGASGSLQFGTEVISDKAGSIAGLLGASPGASVSAHIMLEVCEKLFGAQIHARVMQTVGGLEGNLSEDPVRAAAHLKRTANILNLLK